MSGINNSEVLEMSLDELVEFQDHPFIVPDENDASIQALAESIRENGVMTPAIARIHNDRYELISGHRRKLACKVAGLDKMPVIIREYENEDEAMSAVINSNLHRKEMLPSEKAKVYSARYEILKHQGKSTAEKDGEEISGQSLEIIGKATGESAKTVQRYINLSRLIPDFLKMVNEGKLALTCGVVLSSLTEEQQTMVFNAIKGTEKRIKLFEAKALKTLATTNNLTETKIEEILSSPSAATKAKEVTFSADELSKYIDGDVNEEAIKERILELLDTYGVKD